MENEMDFQTMFEQGLASLNMKIRKGDKVSGTVVVVGRDSVFVNVGGRQEGYFDVKDFTDGEGNITVKVGDVVEGVSMGSGPDGIKLQRCVSAGQADAAVEEAFNAKMPIEGKVVAERKGGFGVEVGKTTAFCPYSQMDLRGVKKEGAEYIGQKLFFYISEYGEEGRNVVLNRRRLLEEEQEKAKAELLSNLQEGDVVKGRIVRLMPFGAFVNIGGVEGMVHISELGWSRAEKPEDVVSEGQEVMVKVLKYEPATEEKRERLSLSIKQALGDPWERLAEDSAFAEGTKHTGKVIRLADFGAFVQLMPGIDGLAHISQLGADHRIEHPSEVLSVGDDVEVTILTIDVSKRRIGLCIGDPKVKDEKPAELTAEEEAAAIEAAVAGQILEGEVEMQKPFGLFVKLPNGQTGLLHISQIQLGDGGVPVRLMYRRFPLHSKINVIVKDVAGDRISLTLPETMEREQEAGRTAAYEINDEKSASFGSLDDLFGGIQL